MMARSVPGPKSLRALEDEPSSPFPRGGYWRKKLHAHADAWEAQEADNRRLVAEHNILVAENNALNKRLEEAGTAWASFKRYETIEATRVLNATLAGEEKP